MIPKSLLSSQLSFDLHTHTSFSDGTLSPRALYQQASARALSAFAITDHDTIDGALSLEGELLEEPTYSASSAPKLLVGVEISSQYRGAPVHILAYGCQWQQDPIASFLSRQRRLRKERLEAFFERLDLLGCKGITREELFAQNQAPRPQRSPSLSAIGESKLEAEERGLKGGEVGGEVGVVGRLHLAKALVARGFCATIEEAFHKWIGHRGKAYVPSRYPEPTEVIAMIQQAGGMAVLAHPQLLPRELFRREIASFAWDGLEAIYGFPGRFDPEYWVQIAQKRGWTVTAGSDFHFHQPGSIFLGCSSLHGAFALAFLQRLEATATGARFCSYFEQQDELEEDSTACIEDVEGLTSGSF